MSARRCPLSHATMTIMKTPRSFLPLVLLPLLLAACTSQTPLETPRAPPAATSPADWYQQAAREGKKVYAIDSAQSLITIIVRRGGPMARFGHDHVVASRGITGFAAPEAGRADFQFRLDELSVDEEALRTEAGLTTQPDADAIAGTRNNMLTRVLDAPSYPLVLLHAQRNAPDSNAVLLTVTLHGVSRTLEVPVRFEQDGASLVASGAFTLLQSDFGITPMSVLGGAIKVEDQMALQFRISAR